MSEKKSWEPEVKKLAVRDAEEMILPAAPRGEQTLRSMAGEPGQLKASIFDLSKTKPTKTSKSKKAIKKNVDGDK